MKIAQKLNPCKLVESANSESSVIMPATQTTKKLYDFVAVISGFQRDQIELISNTRIVPDDQNRKLNTTNLFSGCQITVTQNSIYRTYTLVID